MTTEHSIEPRWFNLAIVNKGHVNPLAYIVAPTTELNESYKLDLNLDVVRKLKMSNTRKLH